MARLSPPAGFVEQRRGRVLWWLKVGWESLLPDLVPQDLAEQSPHSSILTPHSSLIISGGRGPIYRLELETQGTLIVRPYHRGGFVRHFARNLYWDYPPRPCVELSCTEEARRRGVPTVEVVGARVEQTIAGLYRGWLMTREATGFHDLWSWLQTEKSTYVRQQTLSAVAQVIAHMHHVGVAHADLNPTNILVCTDNESPQALLLDFDRARIFSGLVPPHLQEASLRRFRRFFGKHDTREERLTDAEFAYFYQRYHADLLGTRHPQHPAQNDSRLHR